MGAGLKPVMGLGRMSGIRFLGTCSGVLEKQMFHLMQKKQFSVQESGCCGVQVNNLIA